MIDDLEELYNKTNRLAYIHQILKRNIKDSSINIDNYRSIDDLESNLLTEYIKYNMEDRTISILKELGIEPNTKPKVYDLNLAIVIDNLKHIINDLNRIGMVALGDRINESLNLFNDVLEPHIQYSQGNEAVIKELAEAAVDHLKDSTYYKKYYEDTETELYNLKYKYEKLELEALNLEDEVKELQKQLSRYESL